MEPAHHDRAAVPADAQSAIFSPFNLPAYVLAFWTALGWIMALKLWVAAFGTFLLGRALAMRMAGALLAGTTYGLLPVARDVACPIRTRACGR